MVVRTSAYRPAGAARSIIPMLARGILLSALLSLAFPGVLLAREILVDLGSRWKFFRGASPPSRPDSTAWRNPGFSDDAWETGETSIGYGDDDDATILEDMQNSYFTVYARKTFDVADLGRVYFLLLSVDFDDGFVCYINGKEAARANAGDPGKELRFDDPATGLHEAGDVKYFDLTDRIGALVEGKNLIAVEIHNFTLDSTDLTFNARLSVNDSPPLKREVLVDLGSTWRFFRGRSPPSQPDPTEWRNPGFSDDAWETGETSIGYGDDDDATVLEDMQNNYFTVYARKTFDVPDLAWMWSLLLSIDFDDGFVCYINGKEAARVNAGSPGQELSYEDPATADHEAGELKYYDLAHRIGDLVEGENVIAVEIHNFTRESTDLTFNARLSANDAAPVKFTDVGLDIGGSKAAWGDFDNDGFADLLAGGKVWKNDGAGSFITVASVPGDGIWGDYDNDGYLDIFSYSSHRLYRNAAGKSFENVSSLIPALPMSNTRGAVWGDFNGDTFLDLYVGGYESPGYEPDVILMSEQAKGFVLAWQQSGDVDPARGITAADFDQDGDLDIYVSNYRLEQNQLWRNNGTGKFTNAGQTHGVAGIYDGWDFSYGHTIGSAWGDLDSDGHLDLFVGNFSHPPDWQDRPRFYRNLGPGDDFHFADMSNDAGLAWQESFASPALGDANNDGYVDLYFTTVYSGDHSVLYLNEGNFRFADATASAGPGGALTYQAAWGDYDNDGSLDLVTNGRLYRNSGTTNNWLKVRLHGDGVRINRAAIGAQVRATVPGRIITRHVEGATGEGNQNDLTLHVGLGLYRGTVPLEIRWPDGMVDSVRVRPNQTVEWIYGTGRFIRGDCDGDGALGVSDVIITLLCQFATNKPDITCAKSMDFDDDGVLRMKDVIALLLHIFVPGTADPPPPFLQCGMDPSEDDLTCHESTEVCRR